MTTVSEQAIRHAMQAIAEIDPDHLNHKEVIAYLAGIAACAEGLLVVKPDLKAHANLVMDLANRAFAAGKEADDRGYHRAINALQDPAQIAEYLVWVEDASPFDGDEAARYLEVVDARNQDPAPELGPTPVESQSGGTP